MELYSFRLRPAYVNAFYLDVIAFKKLLFASNIRRPAQLERMSSRQNQDSKQG